jgi:hypothetical protein
MGISFFFDSIPESIRRFIERFAMLTRAGGCPCLNAKIVSERIA